MKKTTDVDEEEKVMIMKKMWGTMAFAFLCTAIMARPVTAESLISVPFNASAEEDFLVDPDTGMLMEYTGKNVDVVIPSAVDGVTITGIHHNAFDSCRDYTDTEVVTNRTSWVPLRSIVIPETVEYLEDSCFSYCQQLEVVVCYGPLETTGKNTFEECRSLENVFFVNGVSVLDGYSFYKTEALKTVSYGDRLESIAGGAFTYSGIEAFVVDAENVAITAFWNCENLAELHFTSRVSSIENGAVSSCKNIELLCFETTDLSWLDSMGVIADAPETFSVQVPSDYPEENQEHIKRVAGWTASSSEVTILQEDCTRELQTSEDPTMTYLEVISQPSAYMAELEESDKAAKEKEDSGSKDTVSLEQESDDEKENSSGTENSQEPENTESSGSASVEAGGEAYIGEWKGISFYMGDEVYPMSDLGSEISMVLNGDGTAVMEMDGDELPMTWKMNGENATASGEDMEDSELYFSEEGELYFESSGMGYIFQKEESSTGSVNHSDASESAAELTESPTSESTATPTPSPTPEPTATPTPSPTATITPSPTPEPTATPTPSPTPEPTATPTPSPTPEPTATPTPSPTPEPTATPTPSPTPEPTATPTPSPTPTPIPVKPYEERMGRTFTCTGAKDGGVQLDAASLGAAYSVTFYEDGTVDLVLADISSRESWTQRIVEVDTDGRITSMEDIENSENLSDLELFAAGRRKVFVIDYSGLELLALWTENGFEMNYFDTMTLYFE